MKDVNGQEVGHDPCAVHEQVEIVVSVNDEIVDYPTEVTTKNWIKIIPKDDHEIICYYY